MSYYITNKFNNNLNPGMFTTFYSTNSSVSGERNEQTSTVSISARPEITYIYPEIDLVPRAKVGYSARYQVQGYNFDTVYAIYVSAAPNVYTTAALSGMSAQNLFGSVSGLSAIYTAFNGRKVEYVDIHTRNTLSFTLCATQGAGKVDIIIVNPAGYCTIKTWRITKVVHLDAA